MNKTRINIGLLGCGRISRNHLHAIAFHHENARLVAVCDSNKEKLEACKSQIKEIFRLLFINFY